MNSFGIGDTGIGAVPFESFSREALCKAPQQERFSHRTLHLEVRHRWRSAFDRPEPLINRRLARRTFPASATLPRRRLVFFRFRIDSRVIAVKAREQDPFVAHIQDSFSSLSLQEQTLVFLVNPRGLRRPESTRILNTPAKL